MNKTENNILYTIGHSNHTIGDFICLLKQHQISMVVDVRSSPYSRYCSHFNKDFFEASLAGVNISYMYMGKELGARPNSPIYYDGKRVNFGELAKSREFQHRIKWLLANIPNERIALMCSEKDPLCCHRMILLSRKLKDYKLSISHILEDGTLEEHENSELRLVHELKIEPTLFEPDLTKRDLINRAYQKQEENISHNIEEPNKANV